MKNENKQTVFLEEFVPFDHFQIDRITFDLLHINYGWDDEKHDYRYLKRSSYDAQDVVEFFEQLRFFSVEWILGVNKEKIRIRGKDCFRYHWQTTDDSGEVVRIVCDLPIRPTGEGVIVTIFSLRER